MKTTTAIVLAGGLGTRLQQVVADVPKPMASIREKPFLFYQLQWLVQQGIQHIVLSVGYKHEIIQTYFGNVFQGVPISYVIEKELLGTGGAVKKCFEELKIQTAFVINGDTFFPISLRALEENFRTNYAEIILALKEIKQSARYGTVQVQGNKICSFEEKKYVEKGFINGGIYVVRNSIFQKQLLPEKFSLETDIFMKYTADGNIYGIPFETYFIDIGIPEDYERAQLEIQ